MTLSTQRLVDHAKERSNDLKMRVRRAMADIEADIEKNEGIYPYNAGRVTNAEICRRAGVNPISLHGKNHRTTTLPLITSWRIQLKKKLISGKKVVRKTITDRADDWKAKFEASANWVHLYHVQDSERREELAAACARIRTLECEVVELKKLLAGKS